MSRLKGKTAVITGGGTGIGLGAAQRFVDEGAFVYLFGRRQEQLDAAVAKLGKSARAVRGSVTDMADLDRLYETVKTERGGLDILRHVRASHPDLRVLVLSGYPEDQYAVQMLRAGAHGYVRKSASPEEIRAAVEAVGGGHRHISPELAQLLVERVAGERTELAPLHKTLNEREFQVFCKMAMDHDVPQIARELWAILRRDVKTDWTVRDDVRAKLRSSVKRLLVKYKYPPDQQPEAIRLVIEQLESMAPRMAEEGAVR